MHKLVTKSTDKIHQDTESLEAITMLQPSSTDSSAIYRANGTAFNMATAMLGNNNESFEEITRNDINVSSGLTEREQMLMGTLEQQISEFKRVIQKLDSDLDARQNKERVFKEFRDEWKSVAVILDRFFFVVYIILIIVSLSAMFPRPS